MSIRQIEVMMKLVNCYVKILYIYSSWLERELVVRKAREALSEYGWS